MGSSPGVYWWVACPIHAGLSRHLLAGSGKLEDELNSWFAAAPTLLPIIPLWPGFVANTLLYAGGAYGLLRLPRRFRAWTRRRRGLCPRCAYPIGTSPTCTECGAPLAIATHDQPSATPTEPQRGGRR